MTEHIIQYVQKTHFQCQDVAIYLCEMKKVNLRKMQPVLYMAEPEDPEAKKIE